MLNNAGQGAVLTESNRACEACALKNLRLPRPLNPRELELLDQRAKASAVLDEGATLFSQGDSVNSVYIVRGGAVKTFVTDRNGKEDIIGFFFTGDFIALESLACNLYSMSCAALTKTYICKISRADMQALTHELPSLEEYLFLSVSEELLGSHQLSQILRQLSADERLSSFLLFLAHANERHKLSGTDLALPMSRREIAGYLGLAVETVSRAFSRLQEKQLIAVNDRNVTLLDIEGLRAQSHCCQSYRDWTFSSEKPGI